MTKPAVARDFGEYDRCRTLEKGHGRLESRVLEGSSALNAYLDWPGVEQVLRRIEAAPQTRAA